MADELLNAVIRLEAQIQQQVESEQQRADRWLAQVRQELEKNQQEAQQKRDTAYAQALEEAKKRAEEQGQRLLAEQRQYRRALEEIADDRLLEVLRPELSKLLPESGDDHQDGQG